MGVLSTQSLNLLVKNAKIQIESNNKTVSTNKVEVDTLVAKATQQIKDYFESLYAMDLPINAVLKSAFDNKDGEGKFYIYFVHEENKKFAMIEYYDGSGKRYMISETHIENGQPVDYSDIENNGTCWNYGLKTEQDQTYSEMICRTIMQCFDKIQDTFNLKVLDYVNDACTKARNEAKGKAKTINVLKQNLKEDSE
jgi:hypothetical protein